MLEGIPSPAYVSRERRILAQNKVVMSLFGTKMEIIAGKASMAGNTASEYREAFEKTTRRCPAQMLFLPRDEALA